MVSWGWAIISMGAMFLMFTNWQFAIFCLLIGILMIWRGKKGSSNGNSEDNQSKK